MTNWAEFYLAFLAYKRRLITEEPDPRDFLIHPALGEYLARHCQRAFEMGVLRRTLEKNEELHGSQSSVRPDRCSPVRENPRVALIEKECGNIPHYRDHALLGGA